MRYSIVNKNEIDNYCFRLDAEYYDPKFATSDNLIKAKSWGYLGNEVESIKSFGAYSLCNQIEYQPRGIPFIRCKDIEPGYLNFSDILYINAEANKLLWKSEVYPNTILLAMSGSIGNVALATNDLEYPINSNQDIAKIRLKKLNPYCITAFFNSKFGQNQLARTPVGSIQQHVFIWQIERLIIPKFSDTFEKYMEKVYKSSSSLRAMSKELFNEAKLLLCRELGIQDYFPKQKLSYIRNFFDVQNVNRLDAEFFQPKYKEIIDAIKEYPNGWCKLIDCIRLKDNNHKPNDDKEYKYIELSNVDSNGRITDCTMDAGLNLPTRARRIVKTDNVIVSSVEGSLDSIALVDSDYNNALCSTGFYVLESHTLNPHTLLVYLKSIAGQMQLKQGCNGTILTAISKNYLGDIIIPNIREEIQRDIKDLINESNLSRKTAPKLLEIAKKSVEIAIEQNENAAIKWADKQVESLGVDLDAK